MPNSKLKEFEEKINEFIKDFESCSYEHHCKEYFIKKYSYLDNNEINTLFDLCIEIEKIAETLTLQIYNGIKTKEEVKIEINILYP